MVNRKIRCKQTGRYGLFFEYLNMCDHVVYELLPVACLYWHLRFKEKKIVYSLPNLGDRQRNILYKSMANGCQERGKQ